MNNVHKYKMEIDIRERAKRVSFSGIIFPDEIFESFRKNESYEIYEKDVYNAKLLYIEYLIRQNLL